MCCKCEFFSTWNGYVLMKILKILKILLKIATKILIFQKINDIIEKNKTKITFGAVIMKKIFSKAISIFLSLLLCFGALVPTTVSASAEEDVVLWVGGVEVTKENSADILGNQTATYDFDSKTLTLKNATITEGYLLDEVYVGIYCENQLNIVLEGENSLSIPDGSVSTCGIAVQYDLTIEGDSLVIDLGEISFAPEDLNFCISYGITAESLTVSNAVVTVNSGDITSNEFGIVESVGIYTWSSLEVKDDGDIFATGGNISGDSFYAISSGIQAIGEENALLYVIVRDGGLLGSGGNVTSSYYSSSYGIMVEYGDVGALVNDSYMAFSGGEATAYLSDEDSIAESHGAYILGGSFAADGGNLNFSSGKCEATYIMNDALYTESCLVNDNPFGGYVVFTSEEILPSPHSPAFIGTRATFSSEGGNAICAEKGILIDERLTISLPENGSVVATNDNYNYFAIIDSDGEAAQKAEISVLTYKVLLSDSSRDMAINVPLNQSINETYCDLFEIDDFSKLLITEKEGFVFEGWFTDEEFTNEFSFDDKITSDITVCGKWTPVSDDSSEDVTDDSSEDVTDDSSEDVTDDSSEDVTDDSSEDVTDDSSEDVTDETSEDVTDDSSEDIADETSEDVTDETSEDVTDETSEDVTDETSEDVTDGGEDEATKPGDEGIIPFFILLALSFGVVLAVSKKRA